MILRLVEAVPPVGEGLFSSPWCWNRLLFLFTLLNLITDYSYGATYHSYDISSDRVCSRFRKRELDVFMKQPLILETRPESLARVWGGGDQGGGGTSVGAPLSCTFEVEGKGGWKKGVTSVVQRMTFRSVGDSCVDYVQTVYDEIKGIKIKHKKKKDKVKKKILKKVAKTAVGLRRRRDLGDRDDDENRGPRICGDVLFGLLVDDVDNATMPPPFANPLPPTAPRIMDSILLSRAAEEMGNEPYRTLVTDGSDADSKGELKMRLYVSNRMLRVGEAVSLKVVYTAYEECDGRTVFGGELFHCGYGLCISRDLVNDGLVNCPFGDCIDETNCTNAKTAPITAHIIRHVPTYTSSSVDAGGAIGGVLTFLILSGLIVCCAIYCFRRNKKSTEGKVHQTEEEDDDDNKGGAMMMDGSNAATQPPPNTYYPPQPPSAGNAPGPPPGGQPGYYPMVPQGPPQPGYPPAPPQNPSGDPGVGYPGAPMAGGGYPPYPGGPPAAGYPGGPPGGGTGSAPYPPPPAGGVIGFNMPPLPGSEGEQGGAPAPPSAPPY